jgi:hypothetical protein
MCDGRCNRKMANWDFQREGEWIEAKFFSKGKEGRGGPHSCEPKKCLRWTFRFDTHSMGGVRNVGELVKSSKGGGRLPKECNHEG